ncbi:Golgi transport complex subunit 4 [Microsporum audouinii]
MSSTVVSHVNGQNGNISSPEIANGRDTGNKDEIDIFNASSVADIKATLSQLQNREALVTARLDALVASQKDLSRELGRLDLLRAHLGTQASNARTISHDMLSGAASSAHILSSAVKKLDLEQSRVKSILDMVGQVAELKTCVLGVAGSMGAPQNWEMAASYIHRASKIPEDVINSPFAAEIVPTTEVPDTPNVTLSNAAESLCALFLREFELAVKENDGAKITRFFKLFPLIGKSGVGLDVYGRYVCQGVAARARSNLNAGTGGAQAKDDFFYANALSRLFEHIAQIVEAHGALVERHYGPGKMNRVVERLQVEADVQGGIILESWAEERHLDRKLTDIKSYAFTFLVQSFLPAARGAGTPRSNSPASWETQQRNSEDEGVDMKEIDSILNEISIMLGRWSLYGRFLASKCKEEDTIVDDLELPSFLTGSPLAQKVDSKLLSPYNAMTTFFLRRSVEKAFQLDEPPSELTLDLRKTLVSNPPHITSVVDDIMYIVNKVIQQTLATSQRSAVTSVVPTIARVLGADFIGMVHRKMRDETNPRPVVPGGQPPAATVISFLVLVNNLDVAVDYLERIVKRHMESADVGGDNSSNTNSQSRISTLFPLADDAQVVLSTLRSLSATFTSKAQDLIGDGIQVIFNNVLKARLRPILADAFRDIEYQLQDGEAEDGVYGAVSGDGEDDSLMSHEAESHSIVRQRFAAGWRDLMLPIARILTGNTFDRLLGLTLVSLSKLLEKRLWSYHGRVNALGTTKLERDVTGIITAAVDVAEGQHHGSVSGERDGSIGGRAGRYRHRETFARCAQMVMIMGMEDEEWEEISQSNGDVVDRLSAEERARARAMVT